MSNAFDDMRRMNSDGYEEAYVKYAPKKNEDVVREPSHYKHGTFETIDEMIIVFGPQRTYDYCIINAWKYRSRAPFKGNMEQDMKKQIIILRWLWKLQKRIKI